MTTQDIDIEKTELENSEEIEDTELDEQQEEERYVPKKKRKLAKKIFVVIALCFCAYAALTII